MTSPGGFDLQAFFGAVDARRREEQLSWPALAAGIWEQSRLLNERRNDHPISPATIRNLAEGVSCQHALFVLRGLGVPPEAFIAVPRLLAMRIAQALYRPAADFVYVAGW